MLARVALGAGLLLAVGLAGASARADLKIEKGDHVCIIGNTLAERMQHYGWTETLLQARFAGDNLVIRNLGYSGDEVELSKRIRSKNWGTPDEWLSAKGAPIGYAKDNRFELVDTKADVILAFFGYNESFAGEAGLPKFKKDLDAWIKASLGKQYNGKSAPRIALFSPIAHENLKNADLPDGSANNARLKLYTEAMAEVAKANNIVFVDLFNPTLKAYESGGAPWTMNGVHINAHGERMLASIIDQGLFPNGPMAKRDGAAMDRLNQAVLDKSWHWFHRYRHTDMFSTYGDRGFLPFKVGQTKLPGNYEVMQRELEILDTMTSNRDKAIWAVAQGGEAKIDDSNTPPFIDALTNKPGPNPDGTHKFLSGQDAIAKMTIGKGLKVTLFADEAMFKDLVAPQQMAFDAKGRLWVTAWHTYPHWKPKTPFADQLLILEDTNGDGKADVCKVFASDINSPTGFEFHNGGVIVACGPEVFFLKDTNGDDKYDVKERLVHGMDTADTHHAANSFTFDPGGALYWQEGTFHHSQVESPWGPTERMANGGVMRFEPRTWKIEPYSSYSFANPHGHVWDRWGNDVVIDGTGAQPYVGAAFSGKTYYPNKHGGAPQVYKQRTRPCSGAEILTSGHFPAEMQGNMLVANVIGFQGILQYKIAEKGAGIAGTEVEPIVFSSDPNFRPADIEMGPDGAIYFTDWHNPIIGHMQHNLRDNSRDHAHGRVYKVTHEGSPLVKPAPVAGQPVDALVGLLTSMDDRVRYRAKIELGGRPTAEVIASVNKWLAGLSKTDKEYEHHRMEALWVHQWHNMVNEALLNEVLASPDPRARAAAARVLCYWRDRVKDPLATHAKLIKDPSPRVVLEAVRGLSFFQTPEAAKIAVDAAPWTQGKDKDVYIEYALKETLKTLSAFK